MFAEHFCKCSQDVKSNEDSNLTNMNLSLMDMVHFEQFTSTARSRRANGQGGEMGLALYERSDDGRVTPATTASVESVHHRGRRLS